MRIIQIFLGCIGRIFFSMIFVLSAIQKIFDWQGAEQALINAICDWIGYAHNMPGLQSLLQFLVPWSSALLAVGFAFELLGGVLVLIGIRVKFGAFLLLLFLIPATLLFHHFWFLQGAEAHLQMIMFLKNLSILGALLILISNSNKCGSESRPHSEGE